MKLYLAQVARRCRRLLWVFLLLPGFALPAWADQNADKVAISQRLHDWASAFNARDADRVCDLFAPDLVATVQGATAADRATVCSRLSAMLAQPQIRAHYDPDIQEIILAGDIAVVRLIWTLTIQKADKQYRHYETGMDIFQRQPDGRWSIVRFVAFPSDSADMAID